MKTVDQLLSDLRHSLAPQTVPITDPELHSDFCEKFQDVVLFIEGASAAVSERLGSTNRINLDWTLGTNSGTLHGTISCWPQFGVPQMLGLTYHDGLVTITGGPHQVTGVASPEIINKHLQNTFREFYSGKAVSY